MTPVAGEYCAPSLTKPHTTDSHWTDLFVPPDSAKDCPSSSLEWYADADDSTLNLAISKRGSFLRRFFLMNNGWPNYLLISQHCIFRLISADYDRFVNYSHFYFLNRLKKILIQIEILAELSSNVIISFSLSSCAQCECVSCRCGNFCKMKKFCLKHFFTVS